MANSALEETCREVVEGDEVLLRAALESLERVGCQFWACMGDVTLEPTAMKTCHCCALRAEIQQRLGLPIG